MSFAGLYAGVSIASGTDASSWMLAMVCGLFIYIALCHIVRFKFYRVISIITSSRKLKLRVTLNKLIYGISGRKSIKMRQFFCKLVVKL
jgi:hypothetical protein